MLSNLVDRRAMLGRLMASAALVSAPTIGGRAWATAPAGVKLSDGTLTIEFDTAMQSRLSYKGKPVTPMTAGGYADDARRRAREAGLPLRRLGAPEEIADAILFLLSDFARNITGVDLLADGGLSTTLMTASGAGSGQTKAG